MSQVLINTFEQDFDLVLRQVEEAVSYRVGDLTPKAREKLRRMVKKLPPDVISALAKIVRIQRRKEWVPRPRWSTEIEFPGWEYKNDRDWADGAWIIGIVGSADIDGSGPWEWRPTTPLPLTGDMIDAMIKIENFLDPEHLIVYDDGYESRGAGRHIHIDFVDMTDWDNLRKRYEYIRTLYLSLLMAPFFTDCRDWCRPTRWFDDIPLHFDAIPTVRMYSYLTFNSDHFELRAPESAPEMRLPAILLLYWAYRRFPFEEMGNQVKIGAAIVGLDEVLDYASAIIDDAFETKLPSPFDGEKKPVTVIAKQIAKDFLAYSAYSRFTKNLVRNLI